MEKQINDVLINLQNNTICVGDAANKLSTLCYSENDIDFSYLCGVFNCSGIDGLHKEIQRLKELGKNPHDIINSLKQ